MLLSSSFSPLEFNSLSLPRAQALCFADAVPRAFDRSLHLYPRMRPGWNGLAQFFLLWCFPVGFRRGFGLAAASKEVSMSDRVSIVLQGPSLTSALPFPSARYARAFSLTACFSFRSALFFSAMCLERRRSGFEVKPSSAPLMPSTARALGGKLFPGIQTCVKCLGAVSANCGLMSSLGSQAWMSSTRHVPATLSHSSMASMSPKPCSSFDSSSHGPAMALRINLGLWLRCSLR